jgi:L-alanine-DL-glutamate epimerase-like enolase superfamily enzyme
MHRIDKEVFNITWARLTTLEPKPTVTPFQDATMGPFHNFGLSILTITDENGISGEVPVYSTYNNILETCLFPILLHCGNIPYSELYHRLYWSIRNEGYRGPAAALLGQVDLALHDLAARRNSIPLHQYHGAARNEVKFYGSGGGTNYSLKELEAEVAFFMNAGTETYKMKVGKDFGTRMEEDVSRVKFVRSLLGKNVKLAVDANQIWTCEQAIRFIEKLGDIEIAWFEEPVHSASFDQIEKLCRMTPVKIACGESERTARSFPMLAKAGVRHLQPVPTQFAGVKEWMEVRDLASNNNIDFSSGGYSLFTASLVATARPEDQVEYLYSIMHGLEQYFSEMPIIKNGQFILPDNGGIGVRIDWDYCRKHNKIVRTQTWGKENVNEYRPVVSM